MSKYRGKKKMQFGGEPDPLRPKGLGVQAQDNTRTKSLYDKVKANQFKVDKENKEKADAEILLVRAGMDEKNAKIQANPRTRLKTSQKLLDEQTNKEYRTRMSQGYDPNKPIEQQYGLANVRGLDQRIYRGANMIMNQDLGNPVLNVAKDVMFAPGKSFVNLSNPVENYVKPGLAQGATNLGMDLLNVAPTMVGEGVGKVAGATKKAWLKGYPKPTSSQQVISTSSGMDAVNAAKPGYNSQYFVKQGYVPPTTDPSLKAFIVNDFNKNLEDLQYAKNWANPYGYKIPDNLERIAQSDILTDRTVRGLANRHNTFVRGVSTNWAELETRNPEILRHLEGKGIDWQNNPKAAAEYMATHIPIQTGYGRASLDSDVFNKGMDGLYTSNSIPTAEGYTYGNGYIVKAKRPTNFSSPNRKDWIDNNQIKYTDEHKLRALKYPITSEGEMAMKMGKNPESAIKILEDRVKKYSDDAINYKGDPNFWESGNKTQLENATKDIEYIKKHNKDLFKTIGDEKILKTEHVSGNENPDFIFNKNLDNYVTQKGLHLQPTFKQDMWKLADKPEMKSLQNKVTNLSNELDNLSWDKSQDVRKKLEKLNNQYNESHRNNVIDYMKTNYPDFDPVDRYAHYIHIGTPGEKVLEPLKSTRITPEIWKNKSRAHTNTYTKGLSAAAVAGVTLTTNLEKKQKGGMINYRGNIRMQMGGEPPKQSDYPDYESWNAAQEEWLRSLSGQPTSPLSLTKPSISGGFSSGKISGGVSNGAAVSAPPIQGGISNGAAVGAPPISGGVTDGKSVGAPSMTGGVTDSSGIGLNPPKKKDPYFLGLGKRMLSTATTGLEWLSGMVERNRQNSYQQNQFSTLGQLDGIPATNFQPTPYNLYAKYGGKLSKYQAGGSIVDYLKSKGQTSDKASRQALASKYGIENYDFSASKNLELLSKLSGKETQNTKMGDYDPSRDVWDPEVPAGTYNTKQVVKKRAVSKQQVINKPEVNYVNNTDVRLNLANPNPPSIPNNNSPWMFGNKSITRSIETKGSIDGNIKKSNVNGQISGNIDNINVSGKVDGDIKVSKVSGNVDGIIKSRNKIIGFPNHPNNYITKSTPKSDMIESGIVVDKRTGKAFIIDKGKVERNFDVITGANVNSNTFSNKYMGEMKKEDKVTPVGTYKLKGKNVGVLESDIKHYNGNIQIMQPLGDTPKPGKKSALAMHLTYDPIRRNKLFASKTPWASYGCINCKKPDIEYIMDKFPQGDTVKVIDTKNPIDKLYLNKIKKGYKKGGLTANKAREILHDNSAQGHKLTDKQRRFFGAMSKGHTNYRGK